MKNLYLYLWGAIVAILTLNACTDEANLPVSEENPQEECREINQTIHNISHPFYRQLISDQLTSVFLI